MKTSLIGLGLALALAGCRLDPFGDAGTVGDFGKVGFSLHSRLGKSLSVPVAAGAKIDLDVESGLNAPDFDHVTTGDATLATVDPPPANLNGRTSFRTITLRTTGRGGDVELRVFDTAGRLLDRAIVHVLAPDAIRFVGGWGAAPGPTIVAPQTQRFWVVLSSSGRDLAGTGATHFALSGSLAPGNEGDAPVDFISDSEENFDSGTAGGGTITATSGAASAVLPVAYVDPSAITGGAASMLPPRQSDGATRVLITATQGGTPLYGAECVWSAPPEVTIKKEYDGDHGWTGVESGVPYVVTGGRGVVHATCALSPAVSVPVDLRL